MTRFARVSALALPIMLLALAVMAAPLAKVTLSITGMNCESCATGITAILKRTDGVVRADVRYESREAAVAYEPAKTSPEKIIVAIENLGYKATLKK